MVDATVWCFVHRLFLSRVASTPMAIVERTMSRKVTSMEIVLRKGTKWRLWRSFELEKMDLFRSRVISLVIWNVV